MKLEVKPKLKGSQHLDEKYVKVNGKACYDLNCVDSVTKYVTAHLFVDKRTVGQCVKFLSQVKETCYDQILNIYKKEKHKNVEERKLITFVCDKFYNYKNAFNKLFYRVANLSFGVPIACKKYKLEHNNNQVERYNGKLKDRMNARRGEFKSFDYAEAFMNSQHVMNNFVNPHQGLGGKTPAEEAEIDLRLKRNKLLNLIMYVRKEL